MTGPRVKFTQDFVLYTPGQQAVYPIPETDWERIKRRIKAIVPVKRHFEAWSSFCAGVCGSGAVAIIGLYIATTLPPWVKPATWALTVTAGVLAASFYSLDSQQKVIVTTSTDDVINEMNAIEQGFVRADAEARKEVFARALRRLQAVRQGGFSVGDRVRHMRHGLGTVRRIFAVDLEGKSFAADVEFEPPGTFRRFLLPDANLKPEPRAQNAG
jgi:hypothetical protein